MDFPDFFKRYLKGDTWIWCVFIFFSLCGIVLVYSATRTLAYKNAEGNTEFFLIKHALLVIFSFLSAYVCHRFNYMDIYYFRLPEYLLCISAMLLLFTWLVGTTYNEASRWITIPLINSTFQPSDLAKLALLAYLAKILCKKKRSASGFRWILASCVVICGLISAADFSGGLLLFANCFVLLIIGRLPINYLLNTVLVGIITVYLALEFGQRGITVFSRVNNYREVLSGKSEPTYQVKLSYIALASGGILGKGPGNSIQKNFLPHPYSDFIFAIFVEEYGLMGGMVLIAAYMLLLYRSAVIVFKSRDTFAGLLVIGFTFSIVMQALVHIGVVLGLLPVTGLTLPMLSMGGTSLIFNGIAFGVILSVSRGLRES